MSEIERFVLRVPTATMSQMRSLAQKHNRSLNGEYLQAVAAYIATNSRPPRGRLSRREGMRRTAMHWVVDHVDYNVNTATALAHTGAGRYDEEPERVLYRTPEGYYFTVDRLEEGWNTGYAITTLEDGDAYDLYLELPIHMVSEDEAFPEEEPAGAAEG